MRRPPADRNGETRTPLLDQPLTGPAYAVSGFGKLPRLAFILDGQVRLVPQAESFSKGGQADDGRPGHPGRADRVLQARSARRESRATWSTRGVSAPRRPQIEIAYVAQSGGKRLRRSRRKPPAVIKKGGAKRKQALTIFPAIQALTVWEHLRTAKSLSDALWSSLTVPECSGHKRGSTRRANRTWSSRTAGRERIWSSVCCALSAPASLVTLAVLLAVAAWPDTAGAERAQRENVIAMINGGIKPRKLPRDQKVPVTVFLSGGVLTSDGSPIPRVNWIRLELAWRGAMNTHGLPVCPRERLTSTTTKQALESLRRLAGRPWQTLGADIRPQSAGVPRQGEPADLQWPNKGGAPRGLGPCVLHGSPERLRDSRSRSATKTIARFWSRRSGARSGRGRTSPASRSGSRGSTTTREAGKATSTPRARSRRDSRPVSSRSHVPPTASPAARRSRLSRCAAAASADCSKRDILVRGRIEFLFELTRPPSAESSHLRQFVRSQGEIHPRAPLTERVRICSY